MWLGISNCEDDGLDADGSEGIDGREDDDPERTQISYGVQA